MLCALGMMFIMINNKKNPSPHGQRVEYRESLTLLEWNKQEQRCAEDRGCTGRKGRISDKLLAKSTGGRDTQGESADENVTGRPTETGRERMQAQLHGGRGDGRGTLRRGVPSAGSPRGEAGAPRNAQATAAWLWVHREWPLGGDWASKQGRPRGSLGVSEPCPTL